MHKVLAPCPLYWDKLWALLATLSHLTDLKSASVIIVILALVMTIWADTIHWVPANLSLSLITSH